jgi:hypothetical protein
MSEYTNPEFLAGDKIDSAAVKVGDTVRFANDGRFSSGQRERNGQSFTVTRVSERIGGGHALYLEGLGTMGFGWEWFDLHTPAETRPAIGTRVRAATTSRVGASFRGELGVVSKHSTYSSHLFEVEFDNVEKLGSHGGTWSSDTVEIVVDPVLEAVRTELAEHKAAAAKLIEAADDNANRLTQSRAATARVRNELAAAGRELNVARREQRNQQSRANRLEEQLIVTQRERDEWRSRAIAAEGLAAKATDPDLLTYALGLLDDTQRARFEGFKDARS